MCCEIISDFSSFDFALLIFKIVVIGKLKLTIINPYLTVFSYKLVRPIPLAPIVLDKIGNNIIGKINPEIVITELAITFLIKS